MGWGSTVMGVEQDGLWLKVGMRYLPMEMEGVRVVFSETEGAPAPVDLYTVSEEGPADEEASDEEIIDKVRAGCRAAAVGHSEDAEGAPPGRSRQQLDGISGILHSDSHGSASPAGECRTVADPPVSERLLQQTEKLQSGSVIDALDDVRPVLQEKSHLDVAAVHTVAVDVAAWPEASMPPAGRTCHDVADTTDAIGNGKIHHPDDGLKKMGSSLLHAQQTDCEPVQGDRTPDTTTD